MARRRSPQDRLSALLNRALEGITSMDRGRLPAALSPIRGRGSEGVRTWLVVALVAVLSLSSARSEKAGNADLERVRGEIVRLRRKLEDRLREQVIAQGVDPQAWGGVGGQAI